MIVVGSMDHTSRRYPWGRAAKRGDYEVLLDTNDHYQPVSRRYRRSLDCSGPLISARYASQRTPGGLVRTALRMASRQAHRLCRVRAHLGIGLCLLALAGGPDRAPSLAAGGSTHGDVRPGPCALSRTGGLSPLLRLSSGGHERSDVLDTSALYEQDFRGKDGLYVSACRHCGRARRAGWGMGL